MMTTMTSGGARSVADPASGTVTATVEIAVSPERVFKALTSSEIVGWWVRPGIFNTTEWNGDVRVGGAWRSSGIARGEPYSVHGSYLEVDPPRKLVHTWHRVGAPGTPTTVTYLLEKIDGGTRLTLHHTGFESPDFRDSVSAGWEASLRRLVDMLAVD
jgi:uncharacterized protein YndB with AHSA1/START domain